MAVLSEIPVNDVHNAITTYNITNISFIMLVRTSSVTATNCVSLYDFRGIH